MRQVGLRFAAFGVILASATAAFRGLSAAADISQAVQGLDALAAQSGKSGQQILANVNAITKQQLALGDAVKQINLALVSGFSESQIEALSEVAVKASRALGVALPDAFNRIIKASAKMEKELLDELGIFARLGPATQAYATAVGKTVSQLSEYERSQAFTNAVIEEGTNKFKSINTAVDTSAESFNRFSATIRNAVQNVGITLANIVAPFNRTEGIFAGIIDYEIEQFKRLGNTVQETYDVIEKSSIGVGVSRSTRTEADIKSNITSVLAEVQEPGVIRSLVDSIVPVVLASGGIATAAIVGRNLVNELSLPLAEIAAVRDARAQGATVARDSAGRFTNQNQYLRNLENQAGVAIAKGLLSTFAIGAFLTLGTLLAGKIAEELTRVGTTGERSIARGLIGEDLLDQLDSGRAERLVDNVVTLRQQLDNAVNIEGRKYYQQQIDLVIEQSKYLKAFEAISVLAVKTNRDTGDLVAAFDIVGDKVDNIFEYSSKKDIFGQTFNFKRLNVEIEELAGLVAQIGAENSFVDIFKRANDFAEEAVSATLLLNDLQNALNRGYDEYSKLVGQTTAKLVEAKNAEVAAQADVVDQQRQSLIIQQSLAEIQALPQNIGRAQDSNKDAEAAAKALKIVEDIRDANSENTRNLEAGLKVARSYLEILEKQNNFLQFQEQLSKQAVNPFLTLIDSLKSAAGGDNASVFRSLLQGYNSQDLAATEAFLQSAKEFTDSNSFSQAFGGILASTNIDNVYERIPQLLEETRIESIEVDTATQSIIVGWKEYNEQAKDVILRLDRIKLETAETVKLGQEGLAVQGALDGVLASQASRLIGIVAGQKQSIEAIVSDVDKALRGFKDQLRQNQNQELLIQARLAVDLGQIERDLEKFRLDNKIEGFKLELESAEAAVENRNTATSRERLANAQEKLANAMYDSFDLERRQIEQRAALDRKNIEAQRTVALSDLDARRKADKLSRDTQLKGILERINADKEFLDSLGTTYKESITSLESVFNSFGTNFANTLQAFLAAQGNNTAINFDEKQSNLDNLIGLGTKSVGTRDVVARGQFAILDLEANKVYDTLEKTANAQSDNALKVLDATKASDLEKLRLQEKSYATELVNTKTQLTRLQEAWLDFFRDLQGNAETFFEDSFDQIFFQARRDERNPNNTDGRARNERVNDAFDAFAESTAKSIFSNVIARPLSETIKDGFTNFFGLGTDGSENIKDITDLKLGPSGYLGVEIISESRKVGQNRIAVDNNENKGFLDGLKDKAKDFFSPLTDRLKSLFEGFGNTFKGVLGGAFKGLGGILGKVTGLGGLFGGGGGIGSLVGSLFGGPIGGFLGGLLPFAEGGLVPRPTLPPQLLATGGTVGRDTVPTRLQPGEYVLRRQAVQALGVANLEQLNKGTRELSSPTTTVIVNNNAPATEATSVETEDEFGNRVVDVIISRVENGDPGLNAALEGRI